MIYVGENKSILYRGDFHPAGLYKGNKKIAGYTTENFSGEGSVTIENCYNDNLHNTVIRGNSVQNGTPGLKTPVRVQSVGEFVTEGEYARKYQVSITACGENGESQSFDIYLDEPLRKVGGYRDYIDFEKGTVVRYIAELNLKNGNYTINNQHFLKGTNTSRTLISVADKQPNGGNTSLFLCNRGQGNPDYYWYSDVPGICELKNSAQGGFVFRLPISEVPEQGYFNQWIANNDTTLVYVSKTPKNESVELPTLPTFKGTTIYEINTSISAEIGGSYKKQEVK